MPERFNASQPVALPAKRAPSVSWWCGLTRAGFTQAQRIAQARMSGTTVLEPNQFAMGRPVTRRFEMHESSNYNGDRRHD